VAVAITHCGNGMVVLEVTALLVVVVRVALRLTAAVVTDMIVVVGRAEVDVIVPALVEAVVWLGGAVTVKAVEAESPPGLPLALTV
jgi:hypothetical protein